MSIRRRGHAIAQQHANIQRWLEAGVFLLASLLGIYGIGQGLAGFYEQGKEINLLWLAVTGIAFFVLFAQMGRVHDSWPHLPKGSTVQTRDTSTGLDDGSPDADQIQMGSR
jgi:hypothetical protein